MTEEQLDYVGKCEHGVLMMWIHHSAGKVEINREVRQWLEQHPGGSVERRSVEYAKEHLHRCETCAKRQEEESKKVVE